MDFHPAISAEAHAEIQNRLTRAEQEHEVKIIYAIESGSRAWGFHSPDSDYDVRFVYVRPRDWYLSINVEDRRDVIEYPIVDEIDINGWDLRKALRLQAKSNPAVVEWLHSPIVYREQGSYAAQARALLSEYYHRPKGFYHYRNSAKSNYQQFLRGDMVKLKKYFYVLRPLLAVRWLEQYGGVAPIEFDRLRQVLADDAVQTAIDALLIQKRQHGEAEKQPVVPVLQQWIEQELARLEHSVLDDGSADARAMSALNGLFLDLVK
jgi:predicted nucleotidyltransferase